MVAVDNLLLLFEAAKRLDGDLVGSDFSLSSTRGLTSTVVVVV